MGRRWNLPPIQTATGLAWFKTWVCCRLWFCLHNFCGCGADSAWVDPIHASRVSTILLRPDRRQINRRKSLARPSRRNRCCSVRVLCASSRYGGAAAVVLIMHVAGPAKCQARYVLATTDGERDRAHPNLPGHCTPGSGCSAGDPCAIARSLPYDVCCCVFRWCHACAVCSQFMPLSK